MRRTLTLITIIAAACIQLAAAPRPIPAFQPMCDSLTSYLSADAYVVTKIHVSGASVSEGKLNLIFNNALSEYPLRQGHLKKIYSIVDATLPEKYLDYKGKVTIRTDGKTIEELVSNIYGSNAYNSYVKDYIRKTSARREESVPLVTRLSEPYTVTRGLQKRHIALWQSHGYYYEQSLMRWEWQRGRLMETVEDLYTQSYVLPFLLPMLENAGAYVLLPRERDWNTTELIVDRETPGSGYSESGVWGAAPEPGFVNFRHTYYDGDNPFKAGYARLAMGSEGETDNKATASWTPEFPESGRYAVYVSYQSLENSSRTALYKVRHSGGSTLFSLNQQMGGGTWICLGFFNFDKGKSGQGVYLTTEASLPGTCVTADAVKFGGGKGNIARSPLEQPFPVEGETSGYPRAAEGARYWLQWAGFADTVYSTTSFAKDYTDDYQCRAKWVNILSGGSYRNPGKDGYKVPVDLSFAFHSDAGVAPRDSIIGTLAIFTRVINGKDRYADGQKRDIARDYADAVQTQIVSDIRAIFDPTWTRRGLRDKAYAECSQPEVPSMILELLSHQNFNDMRYGLDPSFRFVVSRAIYKGILKYLAYLSNTGYTVQPLPVRELSAMLSRNENGALEADLKWTPCEDPLEPTATPDSYVVYTRIGNGGFDNGIPVEGCSARIPIEPGKVYSFKVAAVNSGGRSFDSEILSVGAPLSEDFKEALIVNNFDRLSAPLSFESTDSLYAGFLDMKDGGVPYVADISHCGPQFEFRRHIPWMDDDNAGFGASQGTYETTVEAGNTFDFPAVHGESLLKAGIAFSSTSKEAFISGRAAGAVAAADSSAYARFWLVDLVCGKQTAIVVGCNPGARRKFEVFPAGLRSRLADYASSGGNLLVSGAYIASDLWDSIYGYSDSPSELEDLGSARSFITNTMKYRWRSTQASSTGMVRSVASPVNSRSGDTYRFNVTPNPVRYHVESPDAIEPAVGSGAFTIMRYDNNLSAGVAWLGEDYKVVSLGFPIEALSTQQEVDSLISFLVRMLK